MTLVVGVLRPDRPRRVVAEAEARVVAAELARRLGEVTVDLRVEGAPIGPWRSAETAAWPRDVDATVDAAAIWTASTPALTALFGRTVDDVAAEVRTRMLRHLGVLPDEAFTLDEECLRALEEWHVSPTDLWLVANAAAIADSGDVAVDALARPAGTGDAGTAALDAAFDAVADAVRQGAGDASPETIPRLVTERDAARTAAAAAHDELRRTRAELADRLDQLSAENAALRERLERTRLGRELDGRDG